VQSYSKGSRGLSV